MKTIIKFMTMAAVIAFTASGCANEISETQKPDKKGISFTGQIEQTKVTLDEGKSAWEQNDRIGVFAVSTDQTYINKEYVAASSGASVQFNPAADGVDQSEVYYAYYPYSQTEDVYTSIGFELPVTRYCLVDVATGKVSMDTKSPLAGKGLQSEASNGTVSLSFKPVLPVLELALTGQGDIKYVDVELADAAVCNASELSFMSAAGKIDLEDGTVTVESLGTDAHKTRVIFVDGEGTETPLTLKMDSPACIQVATGRFIATGGLKLTFTYSDGVQKSKVIWASKEPAVSMWDDISGRNKHVYQPVAVPANLDMTRPMYICGGMNGWNQINVDAMYPMFKENSSPDNYVYTYVGYMPAETAYKFLPEYCIGSYNAFCLYADGSDKVVFDPTGNGISFWNSTAGFKKITLNLGTMTYSVEDYDVSEAKVWNTIGFIGTINGWGADWDLVRFSDENNHIWRGDFSVPASTESYHCGKFRAEDDWANIWNNRIGFEWSTPFGCMTTSTANDVNIYFGPDAADYRVIFNDLTGHYWVLRR